MRKPLIPTLVLLASAGMLALTGCSPTAGPSVGDESTTTTSQAPAPETAPSASAPATAEQSIAESCALAEGALSKVQSELTGALSDITGGDISGVIAALESFEAQLGETVGQITNPDVSAAMSKFYGEFASVNDLLATAQEGGLESVDQAALREASTKLQTSAQEIQALCT